MNDDVWDVDTNERELQLSLHNNIVERESEKITKIDYHEGYLAGSDFENTDTYQENFKKGFDYTKDFGAQLGRLDAILYLSKLNIKHLCDCKSERLGELKKQAEEKTFKIENNLEVAILEITESTCICEK